MTFRNVILCHMVPGSEQTVGDVFDHYDRATRPQDLGVIGRTLLSLEDLYIHVIERNADPKVSGQSRGLPAFQAIAEAIAPYVTPYSKNWKTPADSVAKEFYSWVPATTPAPDPQPDGPYQMMIVQRIEPGAEPAVARIFDGSDSGPLPAQMGVTGRWLYSLDDVYLHLMVGAQDMEQLAQSGHPPALVQLREELSPYVSGYSPDGGRASQGPVAQEFYRWRAGD